MGQGFSPARAPWGRASALPGQGFVGQGFSPALLPPLVRLLQNDDCTTRARVSGRRAGRPRRACVGRWKAPGIGPAWNRPLRGISRAGAARARRAGAARPRALWYDSNVYGGVRVVRYVWAAPTTILGFVVVLAGAWRARARIVDGVLEAHGPVLAWLLKHVTLTPGGAAALTLGHVVISRDQRSLEATRAHERVHVRQCESWGPLFVPAYLAASLAAGLRGRHVYFGNRFEIEAFGTGPTERRRPSRRYGAPRPHRATDDRTESPPSLPSGSPVSAARRSAPSARGSTAASSAC